MKLNEAKLVCLTCGKKRDGGVWYKASLRRRNSEGKPVISDFFLPNDVGEEAVKNGLLEDVDVIVNFGFDDYMRATITGLTKAPALPKGGQA